MSSPQFRKVVQESRVLRAVRGAATVDGSTVLGSVKAHQVQRDGKPMVLVTREEGWYLTPEQWQGIAEGLHLESGPAAAE